MTKFNTSELMMSYRSLIYFSHKNYNQPFDLFQPNRPDPRPDPSRTSGVLTDLAKLTESSRFLAHSTEDLLVNLSFETDSSSKVRSAFYKSSQDQKLQLLTLRVQLEYGHTS